MNFLAFAFSSSGVIVVSSLKYQKRSQRSPYAEISCDSYVFLEFTSERKASTFIYLLIYLLVIA